MTRRAVNSAKSNSAKSNSAKRDSAKPSVTPGNIPEKASSVGFLSLHYFGRASLALDCHLLNTFIGVSRPHITVRFPSGQ